MSALPGWLIVLLATQLTLVYQFPRAYQPQPAAFRVSYTDATGTALAAMEAPPSAVGACEGLRPGSTDDTYCTRWPTCPPAGVIAFFVQAVWPEMVSASTNLVTCYFAPSEPCLCQDALTYTPPPGSPPPPVTFPPGEGPASPLPVPAPPPFAPVFPPAPT